MRVRLTMTPTLCELGRVKRFLTLGLAAPLALSACAVAPTQPTGTTPTGSTVSCSYRTTNQPAKPVDPPSGADVPATGTAAVVLHFAAGDVTITLDRAAAPCTAHSFESLAQQGWFNDTACHRLGTQGVHFLQCGDPTGTGRGGPGYWFDDELARTVTPYPAGVVAMANSGPNTNGSQFFIVYEQTNFPAAYTQFGRIDAKGLAVITALAAGGTDDSERAGTGRPLADTRITSASIG
nr:peptidylprolyl isomerase [Propionibacterium sp.]